MQGRLWTVLMLAVPCLAMVTGCDSAGGRRPLSGSVTFQGQPVDGTITFLTDKGPVCGGLIRSGQFTIPAAQGLEPGTYRVAISAPVPGGELTAEEKAAGASPRAMETIPPKYNAETVLKAQIEPRGGNPLNFDLD